MQVVFSNDFKISILSIKSVATQKRVKELLHKIADGWRQSDSEKLVHAVTGYGAAYELLEQYKVADQLNLAWTVDIVKDNSHYTQVIKIWDVLPGFRIPNLAKNLSILFEKYTVDFMNSCKYKSFEGYASNSLFLFNCLNEYTSMQFKSSLYLITLRQPCFLRPKFINYEFRQKYIYQKYKQCNLEKGRFF